MGRDQTLSPAPFRPRAAVRQAQDAQCGVLDRGVAGAVAGAPQPSRQWGKCREDAPPLGAGGVADRLLVLVSDHPFSTDDPALRKLTWLICRAFRRMARIVGDDSVRLAERLGLYHAWPAPMLRWPDPVLSQSASDVFQSAGKGVTAKPLSLARIGRALKAYGLCMKVMRWAEGNRREWRLA